MIVKIKEFRLKAGLTQNCLAKKLGVTQSVVAMWERGAAMPSSDRLPLLADILNCTIDALFGRGEESA